MEITESVNLAICFASWCLSWSTSSRNLSTTSADGRRDQRDLENPMTIGCRGLSVFFFFSFGNPMISTVAMIHLHHSTENDNAACRKHKVTVGRSDRIHLCKLLSTTLARFVSTVGPWKLAASALQIVFATATAMVTSAIRAISV